MGSRPGEAQYELAIVYHPIFSTEGYPTLRERVAPAFEELQARGLLELSGV